MKNPVKIFHLCQCCDMVYKVTETYGPEKAAVRSGLTGEGAGDIIDNEPETGNRFAPGFCDECREEIYGPAGGIGQPYRLH